MNLGRSVLTAARFDGQAEIAVARCGKRVTLALCRNRKRGGPRFLFEHLRAGNERAHNESSDHESVFVIMEKLYQESWDV